MVLLWRLSPGLADLLPVVLHGEDRKSCYDQAYCLHISRHDYGGRIATSGERADASTTNNAVQPYLDKRSVELPQHSPSSSSRLDSRNGPRTAKSLRRGCWRPWPGRVKRHRFKRHCFCNLSDWFGSIGTCATAGTCGEADATASLSF